MNEHKEAQKRPSIIVKKQERQLMSGLVGIFMKLKMCLDVKVGSFEQFLMFNPNDSNSLNKMK